MTAQIDTPTSPVMRPLSIASTIESPSKTGRPLGSVWAGNPKAPYSPVLCFTLLAVLALAATIGH
jgi:hypothetical protein